MQLTNGFNQPGVGSNYVEWPNLDTVWCLMVPVAGKNRQITHWLIGQTTTRYFLKLHHLNVNKNMVPAGFSSTSLANLTFYTQIHAILTIGMSWVCFYCE